jgi:hypothetical protein
VYDVNAAAGRSTQVVSRFLAVLHQQIQQDWVHTRGDIRIDSGVPLSWLRGRSPVLSREGFNSKWGVEGGVYAVVDSDLHVCLQHLGDV